MIKKKCFDNFWNSTRNITLNKNIFRFSQFQFLVNDVPKLFMFDKDNGSHNKRFSMISQSFIYKLVRGDRMAVRLHEGALKGGGSHAFTSFLGMKIGGIKIPHYSSLQNEILN